MLDGLKMNLEAAEIGMSRRYGIGIGYAMKQKMDNGLISKDLPNLAMMYTSAAADARNIGLVIPVMSSNGSGNNGLTAILPIAAYRELNSETDERTATALAISHVIIAYIKNHIGKLSPICTCSIAASIGSACGITWLMGCNYKQIQSVIKNILANLSGVFCDGAKPGCTFKLGTAAATAVQAAILAMDNFYVDKDNGYVMGTAENSINHLGIVGKVWYG